MNRYGHWLLGSMSQMGIEPKCTNSTDDIERRENEDFFKSPVSRSQPF